MSKLLRYLKKFFPLSTQDSLITVSCMILASVLCTGLQPISHSDSHVPLIFVLAVLLISLLTDGYFYGLLGSVTAVFGVNFVFTYPYFDFNFSLMGYPLTFLCMFGVSVLVCTLTSRVKHSEQLRIEAEKEKMRANLLRAISHDFRTPLTSMIGAINVVTEDAGLLSEKEKKSLLTDARADAEWLINMVENLLSITRIGADPGTRIHKEVQVVEEVMGEAVSRFRKQYPDLTVNILIPDELLLVPMDAVLIEQVILNLLVNAAIHGKSATHATLSVERDGNMAVFSVRDNGRGIPKDKLATLFDGRTMSSDQDRMDSGPRTMGIGLSVCKTIVTAHGGTMSAKNISGGGARLTFTLPLAEEDEDGNEI